ncbi:MAG TPA: glycosyltransferase family 2 protein [Gemmatimonadaceae bacterium]|nr:glycosyltransferase family 2 protein [Gemmatimonadaceae bacterium]
MSDDRVVCVVPAFNAEPTIAAAVSGLRAALPTAFITVVDDGSTDGTHAAARPLADMTVRLGRNQGKGVALRAGFRVAAERCADLVVTIDADGQHDPRYAPALVEALSNADIAIGARERHGAMPAGRRLTNRLSAAAVARCIGREVADAQSGFRAIRSDLIAQVRPPGDRYEFETEFLIVAGRLGARITFVPIPTIYAATIPSHFRAVRDSARIVKTLWQFGMGTRH